MKSPMLPGRGPLARVPPLVAFLVVIALFTAGVLIKGTLGAALLLLLAAGVAVLLATTWRVLEPGQRVGRVLVLGVLVAVAVSVL
jgi:predicted neutral ceramidase superfamily lipid hydrolase